MTGAPRPASAAQRARDLLRAHRQILALLALALVLRTVALGRDDFWSDEVHTFDAIRRGAGDLAGERLAAGHQPFYFLALRAWSAVFGTSEFALRLPSALAGTLLLLPARSFFRRLAGDRVALIGALLLAIHPLAVELSREARMYPFLMFAWFVAADAALAALDTGRVPWRFWPPLVLGPLLHASWALGFLPLALWIGTTRPRAAPAQAGNAPAGAPLRASGGENQPGSVRSLLLLGCGFSLIVALLAVSVTVVQHPPLTRRPWAEEFAVYVLRQVSGAGIHRDALVVYVAAFVAWGALASVGFTRIDPRTRRFAVVLLVGVHVSCAVAALLAGTAWGPVRYVQVAVVPLVLLTGAGVAATMDAERHLGRLLLAALAGVCAVLLLLRFGPADTRWSAAAARRLRGDPVTAPAEPGAAVVFRHYLEHPRDGPAPR